MFLVCILHNWNLTFIAVIELKKLDSQKVWDTMWQPKGEVAKHKMEEVLLVQPKVWYKHELQNWKIGIVTCVLSGNVMLIYTAISTY